MQHVVGIVGAGAGDDGDTLRHLFHGVADHCSLVLRLDGGILAGGAHDHDAIDAIFDLELDETAQGLIVDTGLGHGGNDRRGHAGENSLFHFCFSPWVKL